jgi:hypothetical protein
MQQRMSFHCWSPLVGTYLPSRCLAMRHIIIEDKIKWTIILQNFLTIMLYLILLGYFIACTVWWSEENTKFWKQTFSAFKWKYVEISIKLGLLNQCCVVASCLWCLQIKVGSYCHPKKMVLLINSKHVSAPIVHHQVILEEYINDGIL